MKRFDLLNTRNIYNGRAFSVDSVEVRLPDGKRSTFDLVRHPGAVALVVVDDEQRILMVRQYRMGADRDLLELPAGTLNPGEPPEVCAAREVREETGFAARDLRKLGAFYMAPGYSSEYLHIFLATGLYPARLDADEDEFIQVEAIAAQAIPGMIASGEIEDGKTLAGLLMARPFLPEAG
jgi:ADP-ribose pyrophosphatase